MSTTPKAPTSAAPAVNFQTVDTITIARAVLAAGILARHTGRSVESVRLEINKYMPAVTDKEVRS